MRKDENRKGKRVDNTGRRIWTAAIVINVIPVLVKLFNVLYFKHSFGKEFNVTYSISLLTIFVLFTVTAIIEKKEK